MNRALIAALLCVAVGAFVVSAGAQGDERPPILHEDVRPPGSGDRSSAQEGLLGPAPAEGRNPSAFASGDKLLPEPSQDSKPNGEEPIHGLEQFAADRNTQWKPDRGTGADGTLHYVEVFNPSVLPFKRMSAMDGVRDDYTLFTRPSARRDLEIGGSPSDDSDRFWGSLMLELETGKDIPIPSVAPNMRILSYETLPRVAVIFSKDAADNYYVRSDEAGVSGQYRLNFLVDARSTYFAPVIAKNARIRDIPSSMLTPLPPSIRETAALAARDLGVSERMRLAEAIDKMAYYFRGFEAKDPPPPTRDIFWDLFKSRAGVCRHRSFAFVIVAQAVGIPARYVTNEAHAWVEVWVPDSGWLRLDLGGAALNLRVSNASGKAMHQPRGEDPFAKPPTYLNNYSRLEGDIDGLSASQIDEARRPADSSAEGPLSVTENGSEAQPHHPTAGPGDDLPEIPAEPGRLATRITIEQTTTTGFRGETIDVIGTLRDDTGVGVEGLGVDIFLALAGNEGNDALWVGHSLSKSGGEFRVTLALPGDLVLGDYEVYAGTPGNDDYAPSVSD